MLIREAADPSLTGRQRCALVRKLPHQEHIAQGVELATALKKETRTAQPRTPDSETASI
ncbi:hypothetical protein ACFYN9_07475 [Streptomyces collinus]|uniref:Uncharacterized protein n=1 Tax=Streptomyces collinus TaxID=42684 RepID=A0AA89QP97_STRCU|nr:hypothetical protein [Streptomyces collinus]MBB5815969.1 hypothetical protein [Streptomyces collinus]WMX68836.1 hypothetical protein RFN52_38105 [Streptomyces collinus]